MSPLTELAYKWMRNFFLDNPGASIDEAAREATHAKLGLHKSEIARIRRDVRKTIQIHAERPEPAKLKSEARALKQSYHPEPIRAEPVTIPHEEEPRVRMDPTLTEPFNTPKIKLADNDPEANMTLEEAIAGSAEEALQKELEEEDRKAAAAAQVPEKVEEKSTPTKRKRTVKARPVQPQVENETMDQKTAKKRFSQFLTSDDKKVKWAAEQAQKNPHETTLALNRRVGKKFGSGFQMPTLGEITRLARESQGIPTKPTKPRASKPAKGKMLATRQVQVKSTSTGRAKSSIEGAIKLLAKTMKTEGAHGIIQVAADGSYKFDLQQAVVTGVTGTGSA